MQFEVSADNSTFLDEAFPTTTIEIDRFTGNDVNGTASPFFDDTSDWEIGTVVFSETIDNETLNYEIIDQRTILVNEQEFDIWEITDDSEKYNNVIAITKDTGVSMKSSISTTRDLLGDGSILIELTTANNVVSLTNVSVNNSQLNTWSTTLALSLGLLTLALISRKKSI